MKSSRAPLAIVILSICASVWVALLPGLTARRWTAELYSTLSSYTLADRALQRDLLMARAGLSRNYDSLAEDTAQISASLASLTRLSARDPALAATVRRLVADGDTRLALTEQFKSGNALLQNSLARLAVTSASPLATKAASLLSAHVLRLTLDTTPNAVADAKRGIDRYEHSADFAGSAEGRQLYNHARLLVRLLPMLDRTAVDFEAVPIDPDLAKVESNLAQIDDAISRRLHYRKLALIGVTALAAIVLLMITLEVYFNVRSLRRWGDFEHLHAKILSLMIDAQSRELSARVEGALECLGNHVHAERAYLLMNDARSTTYVWSNSQAVSPAHTRELIEVATSHQPWADDRIHIRSFDIIPAEQRLAIERKGPLPNSLLLLRPPESEGAVVLGIESQKRPLHIETETMTGLSATLVAILQAVHRDHLEVERLEFERQLAQSRRMETIGAFASGIAHNVNNIIGAIAGFAETAELHVRAGSLVAHNMIEIRAAVIRAQTLVDQVLRFGRRAEKPHERLPLGRFIEETARLLGASLPPNITLRLGDYIPSIELEADAVQLQQVLLNLCHNAAHAMPNGGPIRFDVQQLEVEKPRRLSHAVIQPGSYVVISVMDEGHGIPTSALARLFDPFFTTRQNGTGLGLSTAWEIVQQHGGTIDVETKPEFGSHFGIWLPLADTGQSYSAQNVDRGEGQTILILNPNRDALERDEELVAALGYEPLGVIDVDAALHNVAHCDLLLVVGVDRNFANDALKALRPHIPRLPLVVAAPTPEGGVEALHYPLRARDLSFALARIPVPIADAPT